MCCSNAPAKSCPSNACGTCCEHKSAHALRADERRTVRPGDTQDVRERLVGLRAERRRRAAARRSAHAKAQRKAQQVSVSSRASPLLALPDCILDAVVGALDAVAAARLACEHSVFLGAYTRLFRVLADPDELRVFLAAQAGQAGGGEAALPRQPPRLVVRHLDFTHHQWPDVPPGTQLTLLHARIPSNETRYWYDDSQVLNEERIQDWNACVVLISKLEVHCGQGLYYESFSPDELFRFAGGSCPNCGEESCTCADGLVGLVDKGQWLEDLRERAEAACQAEAEEDTRATMESLWESGFTVPVPWVRSSRTSNMTPEPE